MRCSVFSILARFRRMEIEAVGTAVDLGERRSLTSSVRTGSKLVAVARAIEVRCQSFIKDGATAKEINFFRS